MTRYVLDTDVVIALQRADARGVLVARGLLPAVITNVVWDELRPPGDPGARSITFAREIAGAAIVLEADSAEAGTFMQLQAPKTEGPGEHSVIAYCHHHADTIAVLMDKAGIRRAVEELRGRVLSFPGIPRGDRDQRPPGVGGRERSRGKVPAAVLACARADLVAGRVSPLRGAGLRATSSG